jgi:hypothetical protein
MKKIIISILILVFSASALYSHAAKNEDSIIKIGMDFEMAEELLKAFKAKHTVLQIKPKQLENGEYLRVESYGMGDNPYIIINFEIVNDKKIIRALDLYYIYGNKSDPGNRWINVEEINLKDINP